jgi:hypothetical protein
MLVAINLPPEGTGNFIVVVPDVLSFIEATSNWGGGWAGNCTTPGMQIHASCSGAVNLKNRKTERRLMSVQGLISVNTAHSG